MTAIMDHIALEGDANSFVNTMINCFFKLQQWGYKLTGGVVVKDLEMMFRRVINAEYCWGASCWKNAHPHLHHFCREVLSERLDDAERII
jgi:hypothetical protein